MLIDRHRKQTKQYFWWESLIAEEVKIKRAEMDARRHAKNPVGVDDPTGDFVVRKNMPLRKVTIYVRGKRVTIRDPEAWLDIISYTYAVYSNQPISQLVRERIKTKKSIDVLSGFIGVSRETYQRWEREFFDDASFLAAKSGLFREKNF